MPDLSITGLVVRELRMLFVVLVPTDFNYKDKNSVNSVPTKKGIIHV